MARYYFHASHQLLFYPIIQEKNRLKESIELFKKIQTFQWLAHTTFILFLNKVDVFKEKLQSSDMVDHFTDYKGIHSILSINVKSCNNDFQQAPDELCQALLSLIYPSIS